MKERLKTLNIRHNIRVKIENKISEHNKLNPSDPAERIDTSKTPEHTNPDETPRKSKQRRCGQGVSRKDR